MESEYTTLEDLVRTQYANVFWTHKIQEKQAEIYEFRHKLFSWINIISASLTSAGIISIVFVDQFWIKLVSAIVPSPKKQTQNLSKKPNEKNDKNNINLLNLTAFIPRFA